MFRKPFSFRGRIRRIEYSLYLIIYVLLTAILSKIIDDYPSDFLLILTMLLLYLVFLWIFLAQGAKRCHDINYSGWFIIVPLFAFALMLLPGDKDINKYGPNPRIKKDSNTNNLNSGKDLSSIHGIADNLKLDSTRTINITTDDNRESVLKELSYQTLNTEEKISLLDGRLYTLTLKFPNEKIGNLYFSENDKKFFFKRGIQRVYYVNKEAGLNGLYYYLCNNKVLNKDRDYVV